MESELKTRFEPPADRTPKGCMWLETAFPQLWTMDGLALEVIAFYH